MNKILTGLALATAMAAGTVAAHAETVTIRYSNWLPPTYYGWIEVIEPWTKEIERVTEGRVKVEVLPKVVGSVPGQFDVVRDGLADMSLIIPAYTPGRFNMINFAELPLLPGDVSKIGAAVNQIYREDLEGKEKFDGVKILGAWGISPMQLATKGKSVTTMDDLKGLKIRASNAGATEALKLTGAVPVQKSIAETFELLAGGTIDGQINTASTIVGFNMVPLTDHFLMIPGGLANSVSIMGINEKTWAKISPADQEAIIEATLKGPVIVSPAVDSRKSKEALVAMKEAGYTITEASPEMTAALTEALDPIRQDWIDKAKAAGLEDPQAILDKYLALIAE